MSHCLKCNYPIPAGQEVWMRRKSTGTQVPFCAHCAQEVRQALKSESTQPSQPASPPPLSPAETTAGPAPTFNQLPLSAEAAPAATQTGNVLPVGGVFLLFVIALVSAPLLGGVVALVARHIYLIFVFPLAAGLAGGYTVAQGVKWGKVRDPLVAAIFGLLLGLSVYGCYRYIEYVLVRNDARADILKEMEAEFGVADSSVADVIFDEILREETGKTGFLGVVLLDAQEGMSVGRISSSNTLNIGTTLTWVYWLFEIVTYAGLSALVASDAAGKPFCDYHDRWYGKEKSLGGVNPSQVEDVIGLLRRDDYSAFGKALKQKAPVPGVEFFIERCADCQQSNPILTIKAVKSSSKGKVEHSVLEKQILSPSQGAQILEGIYAQGGS